MVLPDHPYPSFFIPSLTGTVPKKYQLEVLQPITMTLHVNDLRIAEEIRPIFDSTHNDYSAQALTDLLAKPLSQKRRYGIGRIYSKDLLLIGTCGKTIHSTVSTCRMCMSFSIRYLSVPYHQESFG